MASESYGRQLSRLQAVKALFLFILLAPLGFGQNEDLDFKLVNRTGIIIHSVFLSPHNADTWGDDVMEDDVLPDGKSVKIQFHPKARSRYWDLRIEDKGGDSVEWEKLDLTEIETLTIRIVKGKAVAEWE